MNRRLAIGSGLVAVLILCASPGIPAQAAGWKMLPDDVVLAIHFDMKSLADSELYKNLSEQYGQGIPEPAPEYREFIEATGFDVEDDLESVTIGAGMPHEEGEGAFYMIVRGSFDHERIETYLNESGKAHRGTHGKLTTYVPQEIEIDGPEPMIAWTDERTMILASTPDFPRLVRSVRGRGLDKKSSALGRLLTRAHGQFYVALEIPALATEEDGAGDDAGKGLNKLFAQLQDPAAGPMQSLQTVLLTLEAETGLDLALSAWTDSPENGKLVYEMLNSYLTIGRSMAAQDPQAAGILDHLELAHDGSTVQISISMTGDDVRAALEPSHPVTDD